VEQRAPEPGDPSHISFHGAVELKIGPLTVLFGAAEPVVEIVMVAGSGKDEIRHGDKPAFGAAAIADRRALLSA
jgi:hypothetical protein